MMEYSKLYEKSLACKISEKSHICGNFNLRSGLVSDEYFDEYLFESDPSLLRRIVMRMLMKFTLDMDVVAGVELGGIPIAVVYSQATGIPTRFVRKKRKKYGTCNIVEGGGVSDLRVVVIEDVVSTGVSLLGAVNSLRDCGAKVCEAMCIIDRCEGGSEILSNHDVVLHSLFTLNDFARTEVDNE